MSTFYISFGQDHVHKIDGVTLDCDILLKVVAPSEGEARERVFAAIGKRWFTSYTEDTVDFEHFPRGFVEISSI